MNKIKQNKKAVEMPLNILVGIILAIIALAIIIMLFNGQYGENSDKAGAIADGAFDMAKNYSIQ